MWNEQEIRGHVEYLDNIENAVLKAIDKGYNDRDQIHEFVNWLLDGQVDERYIDACISQQMLHNGRMKLEIY